jgi:hypothetical protein
MFIDQSEGMRKVLIVYFKALYGIRLEWLRKIAENQVRIADLR